MRVFLAIDLPQEVKDFIYSLHPKIKDAKITWVSKKNLHLTLKFFGEVSESKLNLVKEKIKIKHKPFAMTLNEIGFFPNKNNPRVIWVSLHPEDKIIELQQKIDELFLADFPSDQKFQSHITVGRIKSIRKKESFSESVSALEMQPIKFKVDSFQLIKSELTAFGPKYKILENVDLS
jgi:2'-5' RNA ligase